MLDDSPVAVKLESRDCDPPQLRDEYKTYKQLAGVRACRRLPPRTDISDADSAAGVPQVHYYGVGARARYSGEKTLPTREQRATGMRSSWTCSAYRSKTSLTSAAASSRSRPSPSSPSR